MVGMSERCLFGVIIDFRLFVLRLGQVYGRGALALEDAVDEDAVLAVAEHVEEGVVEEDLQVPPRDKRRVAHVHVNITT
jgi:hypothetical protein